MSSFALRHPSRNLDKQRPPYPPKDQLPRLVLSGWRGRFSCPVFPSHEMKFPPRRESNMVCTGSQGGEGPTATRRATNNSTGLADIVGISCYGDSHHIRAGPSMAGGFKKVAINLKVVPGGHEDDLDCREVFRHRSWVGYKLSNGEVVFTFPGDDPHTDRVWPVIQAVAAQLGAPFPQSTIDDTITFTPSEVWTG